jgi:hypothetical protein
MIDYSLLMTYGVVVLGALALGGWVVYINRPRHHG